ncbi:unnamed protein product [Rotaria socialis]|uniref:Uncharacterized protein n=1 Tax=Rotaria socialis TaxID=392032 RepID=A0A818HQT1_9BILA|nr:unnamed protein product [Rotaria socialis]CAF3354965.1 unnamed protein product [Rotaria socialis]CAF3382125.1 unnamed protein product [Rotaria socialis]CAF3386244.1 unnamed protein product [Rotaria socialis]CAF3511850.1 unnamed protein product [Rotaria socialis]
MKSIIITAIVFLHCATFNEALQCYSHDTCTTNCPQLSDAVRTCANDDNRCYKLAFPGGVSRGCVRDRCSAQINGHFMMANICCEKDLCNSATTPKMTLSGLFILIAVLVFSRI